MKKSIRVMFVMVLCIAMAMHVGAFGEDNSPKVLGSWEISVPDEGDFVMVMKANGMGEYLMDGQSIGEFAFVVRGNIMAGAMYDENGNVIYEPNNLTFVDDDTITKTEGETTLTLNRIEAAAETEIVMDNAFIGTWSADIVEGGEAFEGVVMEYKADGTYQYNFDGVEGECSYLVYGDTMVSLDDDGTIETFTFEAIDADTMDVTSAEGVTARFVRQTDEEKPAA